eukprot:GHVO01017729.1.p1 GENE.GHVO01017729.1~~GHVO01017729.1.p1  ORF type:complete len:249 (-),score=71.49 GHVO01017729.1:128-874(-)
MSVPKNALKSILTASADMPDTCVSISGINFESDDDITVKGLMDSFRSFGFQASHLGQAVDIVNAMLDWTPPSPPSDDGVTEDNGSDRCRIWLSFTSNMISSGLRDVLVYLAKHSLIDVFVTSAGGGGCAHTGGENQASSTKMLSDHQQRTLLLARLILHRDELAVVLIDEPPEIACDGGGEGRSHFLNAVISSSFRHACVLVVSHNVDVFRECSCIWIMSRGRIAEMVPPSLVADQFELAKAIGAVAE